MTDRQTERVDVAFRKIFESFLKEYHTVTIAQVTEFDKETLTIKAQPVLQTRIKGQDAPINLPPLEDVPISIVGNGNYLITFPFTAGTYVIILIAERSIENWLEQGGIVDPDNARLLDLSDAIALPCSMLPTPDLIPDYDDTSITIRNLGGTTSIKLVDDEVTITSAEMVLEGNVSLNGNLDVDGTVTATGDVEAEGEVTANSADVNPLAVIGLTTHIHNVPAAPGPSDGPESPPGP